MAGRAVSPVFVGRSDELSQLVAAHQRAVDRRPATVVVSGEAGIGKSRLVSEFLAHAVAAGTQALVGRCASVSEATLPYAPFVEALRSLTPTRGRSEVVQLLAPALETAGRRGARPAPLRARSVDLTGQVSAFAAILDLLERRARRRSMVLVIEDLHWAGSSTVELALHIARNAPTGLLLVITIRRPEPGTAPEIQRLLPEFISQEGGQLIELDPLGGPDIARLIEEIVEGPPQTRLLEEVAARSGGNPLFIEELCSAAVHGRLDDVPAQLRELVLARTIGLGAAASRLVALAAVIGDEVDLPLVARAAGMTARAAEAAFGELLSRAIVHREPGVVERLRFRHSVVREVIDGQLADNQRREMHRRVAEVLQRGPGPPPSRGHSAALAYHWQQAGEPAQALPHLLDAAEDAVMSFAFEEASALLARAVDIQEAGTGADLPSQQLWRTFLRAGEVAAIRGDPLEADRLIARAYELAPQPDDRFLVRERQATWAWHGGDERRAYAIWQELADGPRPSDQSSAEVVHGVARGLMYLARFADAVPIAKRAVERARDERRPGLEAEALVTLGMALSQSDQVDAGIEAFHRAARLGTEIRSFRHMRPAFSMLSGMLAEAERFEESISAGEEYLETARRLNVPPVLRYTAIENFVSVLQLAGRWGRAAELLDEALKHPLPDRSVAGLLITRALLRCQQGQLDGAERDLDRIRSLTPRMAQHSVIGAIHAVAAEIAIWRDHPDIARQEVVAGLFTAADRVQAQEDMFHELTLLGMRIEADEGLRQRSSRQGQRSADSAKRAARVLRGLRERGRRRASSYTLYRGLIHATYVQCRAEARRLRGRAAPDQWATAAGIWAELRRPYQEAYARLRLAESLVADASPAEEATRAASRAFELTTRLGALPLRGAVEALIRRFNIGLGDVTALAEQAYGVSLTRRERDVLRLMAAGMSNREIGTELGIAEKTTEIHVSNTLRKLGVERRLEAVMLAIQRGLLPLDAAGQVGAQRPADMLHDS